jgi:hypothetical protein
VRRDRRGEERGEEVEALEEDTDQEEIEGICTT